MAKIDFITLANIIFKDKDKYKYITDEDKEQSFFILNRKFALFDVKKAQFFNNKSVDKASAIDIWYNIFYLKTKGTPSWWWKTQLKTQKEKPKFTKEELSTIKNTYNLKENDIKFLINYYEDKVKTDIKRIKKFQK